MGQVFRKAIAAGAVATLLGIASPPAHADQTFPFEPPAGTQLTGIAWDPENREMYVATAKNQVLVVDDKGKHVSDVRLAPGLKSVQALAYGKGKLYVGDIGGRRETVTVQVVDPQAPDASPVVYTLRYPDGPHDAKAMALSGRGRLYIATSGENPRWYSSEIRLSRGTNRLTRREPAPRGVTDGAFLADGATLALRTARGVEIVDAFSWETKATARYVNGRPDEVLTPYSGNSLVVGSAGSLRTEPMPAGHVTVTPAPAPSASTTAGASPAASATPGQGTESGQEQNPPVRPARAVTGSSGTKLAILGALVVALLAGAVVAFTGRGESGQQRRQ